MSENKEKLKDGQLEDVNGGIIYITGCSSTNEEAGIGGSLDTPDESLQGVTVRRMSGDVN